MNTQKVAFLWTVTCLQGRSTQAEVSRGSWIFIRSRYFYRGLQFWTQKSGGISDCLLLPWSCLSFGMWHHPIDEGQADLSSFLTHWILAMAGGGRIQWFDLTGQEVAHQQYSRTRDAEMGDAVIHCDKRRVSDGWTNGLKWPIKGRINRPMAWLSSKNLGLCPLPLQWDKPKLTFTMSSHIYCVRCHDIMNQAAPFPKAIDSVTRRQCLIDGLMRLLPSVANQPTPSSYLSLLQQSTFVTAWPQALWITSSLMRGNRAQLVRWLGLWISQASWWEGNSPAGTICPILLFCTSVAP